MGPTRDLQARLDHRLRCEQALAELSAMLMRRGGIKSAKSVLVAALAPLREASGADRVYLFENYEDPDVGLSAVQLAEVVSPDAPPVEATDSEWFPYRPAFQRWIDLFLDSQAVHGPISRFPEPEAELLRASSVVSILVIPVWVECEWGGILGFDDMRHEREWTEDDIRLLETAAQVIGAFLERGRVQESLQKAQTQLIQTEKMATIGALVAGVAHEINTPLGAIRSMQDTLSKGLEKLRSKVDTEDAHVQKALRIIDEANRVIHSGSQRVLEIVRRLKDFARYDEGELEQVDLRKEIEDTLSIAHHELKHGITVRTEMTGLPLIEGHSNQLNQVFLNLIVNAKQAMVGRGELEIRGRVTDGLVELRFTDSGPGIPDDKLSTIFEPGFTTKKKGAGLGLGLAICQQVVTNHHGKIWAENSELGGACFVIVLPVVQPEETEAVEPAS
ncbi:MAG: sensor histidine kinase [Myxococcota bacterium]